MGYLYMTLLQISTESTSERILKIGQYLVKLWARVWCLVFLTHGVEKVRVSEEKSGKTHNYLESPQGK